MIPKNITRGHVLEAIREINRKGVPKGRNSRKFIILYEGEAFPPKYVISIANKYANGIELDSSKFCGGTETNRLLINLGFEILDKTTKIVPKTVQIRLERAPLEIISPLLESAREKLELAEEYIRQDRAVLWSQTVTLSFDAIMDTLQEKVVDLKGIKVLEQLRKDKKLYLDIMVSHLQEEGLLYNFKNLEKLKDLRNKVIHEGHHPSRKNALWAFNVARSFIMQIYPEIIR